MSGNTQAQHQAADLFLGRRGSDRVDVAARAQGVEEEPDDLLGLPGVGGLAALRARGYRRGVARQFVEAKSDRLAQVHREILAHGWDAHQPVAVAEILVRKAKLLRAEQQ